MICNAVQAWLMSARGEPLPTEVAGHLRNCPDCAQFRQDLRRVDRQAIAVPVPAVPEPRLETLLASLPDQPPPTRVAPPIPPRPGFPWLTLLATVVISFLLGWFFGTGVQPASNDSLAELRDPDLAALADVHVRLAATYDGKGQVRLLEVLAARLRLEAMKLARSEGVEYVPLLAALHEQTLKAGLLRSVASIPAGERGPVGERIQADLLRSRDRLLTEVRHYPDAVADLLAPFARAAQETAELLRTGNEAPPVPAVAVLHAGTMRDLVASLVCGTVDLVQQTDPLRRAACTSVVAEQIALAVRLAQVRGDTALVTTLEETLDTVVLSGMEPNLHRAQVFDPDNPRLRELRQAASRLHPGIAPPPPHGPPGHHDHGHPRPPQPHWEKDWPDPHKLKGKGPPEKHDKREWKGVIRAVDSVTRSLRLAVRERENTIEITYVVPSEVRPRQSGKDVHLTDLAIGSKIQFRLRDAFTIAELRLEKDD